MDVCTSGLLAEASSHQAARLRCRTWQGNMQLPDRPRPATADQDHRDPVSSCQACKAHAIPMGQKGRGLGVFECPELGIGQALCSSDCEPHRSGCDVLHQFGPRQTLESEGRPH